MAKPSAGAAGRFCGQAIVITGAASGIGRACALRLSEEGADIVGLDLSADGLATLRSDIAARGRRCETITGSVADIETIDAAIDRACQAFGGLDGIINNAGIGGPMQRYETVESADFDKMIAINLKPVWHGMKRAHAPLCARGGGAIVNVASMAGLRPNRTHALYGMTKAAVISLTYHAAMDFAGDNIRVNCLCPGPVETPIFGQMRDALGDGAYEAARKRVQQRTLMNRFGSPEEQAGAVAYLMSAEASFVTGIAMPVDGGWSISDGRI